MLVVSSGARIAVRILGWIRVSQKITESLWINVSAKLLNNTNSMFVNIVNLKEHQGNYRWTLKTSQTLTISPPLHLIWMMVDVLTNQLQFQATANVMFYSFNRVVDSFNVHVSTAKNIHFILLQNNDTLPH